MLNEGVQYLKANLDEGKKQRATQAEEEKKMKEEMEAARRELS